MLREDANLPHIKVPGEAINCETSKFVAQGFKDANSTVYLSKYLKLRSK